jgi:hypothetical protein
MGGTAEWVKAIAASAHQGGHPSVTRIGPPPTEIADAWRREAHRVRYPGSYT